MDINTINNVSPKIRILITSIYVAIIYLSLPYIRGLVLSLRENNLLSLSVTASYLLAGGFLIYFMLFILHIKDIAAYILMSIVGMVFAYFIMGLEIPEERIHFIQYSILSGLLIYAFLLSSSLGFIDEIIQYFLPTRYFDWRDVGFNIGGSLCGVALFLICKTFILKTSPHHPPSE